MAFARRRSHQRRVPILLTLLRLGLLKTTGALTNSAAPTYDAAGNTLTINGAVYAYDQKNQLKSISGLDSNGAMVTVNHQYDSMGRRISSTVNNQSILYVYDGWNVVEEYSSSNLQSFDLKTILTWGIDLSGSAQGAGGVGGFLFTEDITSNTTWHHHYDGNGNVTHLTNASGQTVATYTYDAFGNTVTATGVDATANRYRFSTKPIDEHIATTPLYYYGYRYYHPQTGRWINRDPIEEEGGLNLYGFVGNDSISNIDVLGRNAFALFIATFANVIAQAILPSCYEKPCTKGGCRSCVNAIGVTLHITSQVGLAAALATCITASGPFGAVICIGLYPSSVAITAGMIQQSIDEAHSKCQNNCCDK